MVTEKENKQARKYVIIDIMAIGFFCTSLGVNYYTYVYISFLTGKDYGAFLLTKIDTMIPVYTMLIPSYLFFYVYIYFVGIVMQFLPLNTRRKVPVVLFLNYFISLFIFILLPTNVDALIAATKKILPLDNSLYVWLITYLEPNAGAFPSLHVSLSLSLWLLFWKNYPDSRLKQIISGASFIWLLTMAFSTMSLKIHYLVDVLSGVALGYFCYYLAEYKDIFGIYTNKFWKNNFNFPILLGILTLGLICLFFAFFPQNTELRLHI